MWTLLFIALLTCTMYVCYYLFKEAAFTLYRTCKFFALLVTT